MAVEVAARAWRHPAFAIDDEDLRQVLELSDLPDDLRRTIALIPTVPRPDVSSVLAQVCAHLGVPSRVIRCKTRSSSIEEQLNSCDILTKIGMADRTILDSNVLKVTGHHMQWPGYLEFRMKAKKGADEDKVVADEDKEDVEEDKEGVEVGVFAVILATALWRCNHRLIINRCKGD